MEEKIKAIDVKPLLSKQQRAYDFVLDGTHFGRGNAYISEYEQVKYQYTVNSLKRWKVNENENSLEIVRDNVTEHFYSKECYVVYVKYDVTIFDLNTNNVIKNENSDRYKEIYFYWRGWHAPKGCSPLPKELNVEDVPVERTYQWTEMPVFLRLFNGKLIVHNNFNSEPHLYMLCGTVKEEVHFMEVPKEKSSLRSRTSFLLVLPNEYQIFIWHGSKTLSRDRSLFESVLLSLQEKGSYIYGNDNEKFQVTEVSEKQNDEEFINCLKKDSKDYFSLNSLLFDYEYSPRLFYLNNITGEFIAIEIEYTLGSEYLNPFPFLQDHLYTAAQPALFLLDNNHELWLWQGWKTETTTEEQVREFEKQRECALQTAMNYWHEKYPGLKENVYLVAAGREPLQFINIFPFWITKHGVDKFQIPFSQSGEFTNISTKFF